MISPITEKMIVGLCVLAACYKFYTPLSKTAHPALYLALVVTLVHMLAHEVLVPCLRKHLSHST